MWICLKWSCSLTWLTKRTFIWYALCIYHEIQYKQSHLWMYIDSLCLFILVFLNFDYSQWPSSCVIWDRSCWVMPLYGVSAFILGWRYVCMHSCTYTHTNLHFCVHPSKKKNAVRTDMLLWWPRDGLVITSMNLSGLNYRASGKTPLMSSPLPLHLCAGQPVCPPTAGLTSYLINIDRPLVRIHTHKLLLCLQLQCAETCSDIALHM